MKFRQLFRHLFRNYLIMQDFKDYIKNSRAELGLSQEDLAKYLGKDKRTIQYWESGESIPRSATIQEVQKFIANFSSGDNIMIDSENFVESSLVAQTALQKTLLSQLCHVRALLEKRPFAAVYQEALKELQGFENEE